MDARGRNGHAVVAGVLWRVRSTAGPLLAGSRFEVLQEADGILLVARSR